MFFASNVKPLLGQKQCSLLLTSNQLVTEVVCYFCGVLVGWISCKFWHACIRGPIVENDNSRWWLGRFFSLCLNGILITHMSHPCHRLFLCCKAFCIFLIWFSGMSNSSCNFGWLLEMHFTLLWLEIVITYLMPSSQLQENLLQLCCTCLVCFSGIWNRSCLKILCNLSSGLAQLGCAWFSSWIAREAEETQWQSE